MKTKYTLDTLPDTLYFSSASKLDELKGTVYLSPYIGISSMFIIRERDVSTRQFLANNIDPDSVARINANLGYVEWGVDDNKLTVPLSTVHIRHNIPELKNTATGNASGYIYAIDISECKDRLSLDPNSNDANREVIYNGDKPLKIISITPHRLKWICVYDRKEIVTHGKGRILYKDDTIHRVTYKGIGIYEAIKQNVSMDEWKSLLKSKEFKWLPKPPEYPSGCISYFTDKGLELFNEKVLPIAERVFNNPTIDTTEQSLIENDNPESTIIDLSQLESTLHNPQEIFNWIENHISDDKESNIPNWILKSPNDVCNSHIANSHNQSLLTSYLLSKLNIENGQLFFSECKSGIPVNNSHTLTWYKENGKYYWLETSWESKDRIYGPYSSLDTLKRAVFIEYLNDNYINSHEADGIIFSSTPNYEIDMSLDNYINSWGLEDTYFHILEEPSYTSNKNIFSISSLDNSDIESDIMIETILIEDICNDIVYDDEYQIISKNPYASYDNVNSPDNLLDHLDTINKDSYLDTIGIECEWFTRNNYNYEVFYIDLCTEDAIYSHSFLVYKENDKYYWFESVIDSELGIHKFNSLDALLESISTKMGDICNNVIINDSTLHIRWLRDMLRTGFTLKEYTEYAINQPEPSQQCFQRLPELDNIKNSDDLLDFMNDINYGWISLEDNQIYGTSDDDDENYFYRYYYLQSPSELLESKVGVCWDQTELERVWFDRNNYEYHVFFICTDDESPSHTFLAYKENDKYYWFEHSWYDKRGIHEFETLDDLLDTVSRLMENMSQYNVSATLVELKDIPPYGCSYDEYNEFILTQQDVSIY